MNFVKGERLRLKNAIFSLKHLRNQIEHNQEFLLRSRDILDQFEEAITNLKKRMHDLPVAHRYEGEFYIKKPATKSGPEFEKKYGVLLMQENHSTWTADESRCGPGNVGYSRYFYKEPAIDKLLGREDGSPIFEEDVSIQSTKVTKAKNISEEQLNLAQTEGRG